MTLKDMVAQKCPEDVGNKFIGGVRHCPGDYDFLCVEDNLDNHTCPVTKDGKFVGCLTCWNREYKETKND